MHAKFPLSIAICMLTMAGISLPANADVNWSSAGYYLSESDYGFDLYLISGPYSNEADCKSAISALSQDDQEVAFCDYYASDPLKEN